MRESLDITFLHRRLLARRAPASLFPVVAYSPREGLFLLEDGALGFAFVCYPLLGVDEGRIRQLQGLATQDYPAGTLLQISLWAGPDVEPSLARMLALRAEAVHRYGDSPAQRVARAMVERRAAFLRSGTRTPFDEVSEIRLRDLQVLLSVRLPSRGSLPDEQETERAFRLQQATGQSLATLGMGPAAMDPEIYLRVMGCLLNRGEHASWRQGDPLYDNGRLIRDQLVDTDTALQVDSGGLWLGDGCRVKVVSAKRMPEHVHLANAFRYLGDPRTGLRGIRENVLITLNVLFGDPERQRSVLETKKNTVTWQSMGPLRRYVPRLQRQADAFDVLFEALDDGDRVVQAYLSWAIFAEGEDHATTAVSNLITYYRDLGFRLKEDRFICLPLFLNALPLCAEPAAARHLMRYRTMAGRHATHVMPLVGDWKGTPTPALALMSRNGQLIGFDLFDSPTNYNAVVAAESGSGKSFFMNYLVSSYLSLGAAVWVIEVGRSFKSQAHVHRGEHLEFTAGSRLSLNPFSAVVDYREQADILIATLVTMISPSGALDEYQVSRLRAVVKELWEEHAQALSVDLLAERLLAYRDEDGQLDRRVNDMGAQLYPFTSAGEYGHWFQGRATVDFTNPLTVIELEELKGRKHLQKVVLVQLISVIQRAMFLMSDDSRPKLLVIDEGWDLLTQGGAEGEMIERGVRQLRKYHGGVCLILQGVNDLYKTPVGEAFAENSAHKILMGQTAEAIEQLNKQGRLCLGEGGLDLLKTVHTVKGRYSEMLIYTRQGAGIARLVVDRFFELMSTTYGPERALIQRHLKQGLSYEQAIDAVIAEERRQAALKQQAAGSVA